MSYAFSTQMERGPSSVEDARRKLSLDLYYIKHMSIELDLAIICRTLGTLCGSTT